MQHAAQLLALPVCQSGFECGGQTLPRQVAAITAHHRQEWALDA
jgi:hypothetical protein